METPVLRKGKAKSDSEILSHEFLTIPEVAQLLRVTQRTVYNLIYGGSLQAVRISGRITIIQKTDFINMLKINEFNSSRESQSREVNPLSSPTIVVSQTPQPHATKPKMAKKESQKSAPETKGARTLKPSSSYKQSVKDTFIKASDVKETVYTMEEICRKFSYTYGRFHNLRLRYEIPCVKLEGHKCFPKTAVDEAMQKEKERLGQDLSKDWYSCFDLMKRHGLGKTQVRRFATTHGVRMKKMYGRKMFYLKADWDAVRNIAEEKSTSTKVARQ